MKRNHHPKPPSSGFSLTELLVVIVIIAVLASLGFMGISSLTKRANAAKDAANLREIWVCIPMYSGDYNDLMPGPLHPRQAAQVLAPIPSNPRAWRRLIDCLAPYLGYENPKKGEIIHSTLASWQRTPESLKTPAYVMQQKLPIGLEDETKNPWGIPDAANTESRYPMRMSQVMAQPKSTRTWAITELDQLHPNISTNQKKGTPEGMTHDTYRLGIYFDGSIGKFNMDNKPL